jgi:hypothetical protein
VRTAGPAKTTAIAVASLVASIVNWSCVGAATPKPAINGNRSTTTSGQVDTKTPTAGVTTPKADCLDAAIALPVDDGPSSIDTMGGLPPAFPLVDSNTTPATEIPASIAPGLETRIPGRGPNGDPIVLVLVTADPTTEASVSIYYSSHPVNSGLTTIRDLLAGGGSYLQESVGAGNDAKKVLAMAGDRASLVQLAAFTAALTHTDPLPIKTWNLVWSEGGIDFILESDSSARETVVAARSIYCGT